MNILLVDDQKNVIDGLLKGISWNKLGISNVYKAYNSSDAKALFNNIQIDILLTDIEMPGENGIKLVQWVRELEFPTECIFLTSHADFEYAKDAIKVKSLDYILQPCSYEEIEHVISFAIQKIESQNNIKKLSSYGKILKNDFSMQELVFYNYIKNNQSAKYLDTILLEKKDDFSSICGYASLFQVKAQDNNPLFSDPDLLKFCLHNIIDEKISQLGQQALFCETSKYQYALYLFSYDQPVAAYETFIFQINTLKNMFMDYLHINSEFFVSKEPIVLEDIPEQLEKLKKEPPTRQTKEQFPNMSEETNSDPIYQIKEYVKVHIEDNLSRSILAEYVHLNADYLSRMFKTETGFTLNDYVTIEKMKWAQNLIHTTLLPIGLIASKVGYDNFSYFSKLYKKIIGVSPTEDRTDKKF